MRVRDVDIAVEGRTLVGRVVEPRTTLPGVLFVHGWAGSQERDTIRAREIAQLGCVCLTFDLRGHGATAEEIERVTREQNLADLCSAFDRLTEVRNVDPGSVAVVGSSYGGYLATLLTARRPVRWLALRVPALYRDEDWTVPKHRLDREQLARYRRSLVSHEDNLALGQSRRFTGDVLVVESEHDEIVPHPAVASYLAGFLNARSLTYRIIEGADHALSDAESRAAYDRLLVRWIREMIFGAR